MLAEFTKKEKKVIRKIVRMQLESLKNILGNPQAAGVPKVCSEAEIDIADLRGLIRGDIKDFEGVLKNPCKLLTLDIRQLSITKSILHNFFWSTKYMPSSRRIHRKIRVMDMLEKYPVSKN